MRNSIIAALNELENDHSCHVLFACESGSRAWGFASLDSDFDVRFIYKKPLDWYLQLDASADSIDIMLPDDLDLCGWDLRKALTLFSKGNVCLFEWLGSPEIYYRDDVFHDQLKGLIPYYFNPKKALYHYLSTAKKMQEKHLTSDHVNVKKIFYIIRPLLACKWIIKSSTMPPTEFEPLYLNNDIPQAIRQHIQDLLLTKNSSSEKDRVTLPSALLNWINFTTDSIINISNKMDSIEKPAIDPLNQLLISNIT